MAGILGSMAALAIVAAAASGLMAVSAHASALAPEECTLLNTEKKSLETAGVLSDLAQSPGLAQYTFSSSTIERMKHYLDVKEKVLFRCPNLIVLVPKEVEDSDAASPEAAKAAAEAAIAEEAKKNKGFPFAIKSDK